MLDGLQKRVGGEETFLLLASDAFVVSRLQNLYFLLLKSNLFFAGICEREKKGPGFNEFIEIMKVLEVGNGDLL